MGNRVEGRTGKEWSKARSGWIAFQDFSPVLFLLGDKDMVTRVRRIPRVMGFGLWGGHEMHSSKK